MLLTVSPSQVAPKLLLQCLDNQSHMDRVEQVEGLSEIP